ncbi:interleukin 17a/f1 [Triplophysa rosa]|uniref:interleukin 17a/f1 n=1 Tax=Triplophysa rosa TaxID=992332 RepID=UPI002546282C|nr:interleukin 17a/f1 [Triplophysa rosa]
MSSAFSIQFLTVACMMGVFLISFGAEGLPAKTHAKKGASDSFRLFLDPEFKHSSDLIRPINNDSISPWTYTFKHDETLYPSNIAEAKCLLTGCLINGEEVHDYQSKPIISQILVLRKIHGDKHSYSFRLEYKTISVGCTCVRPYVEYV